MPNFTNRYFESMPHDPIESNYTRQVSKSMLSKVSPTPVSEPKLLGYAFEVAEMMGISKEEIEGLDWLNVLSGNGKLNGMETYAHCYAGHQFGYFTILGEISAVFRYWALCFHSFFICIIFFLGYALLNK